MRAIALATLLPRLETSSPTADRLDAAATAATADAGPEAPALEGGALDGGRFADLLAGLSSEFALDALASSGAEGPVQSFGAGLMEGDGEVSAPRGDRSIGGDDGPVRSDNVAGEGNGELCGSTTSGYGDGPVGSEVTDFDRNRAAADYTRSVDPPITSDGVGDGVASGAIQGAAEGVPEGPVGIVVGGVLGAGEEVVQELITDSLTNTGPDDAGAGGPDATTDASLKGGSGDQSHGPAPSDNGGGGTGPAPSDNGDGGTGPAPAEDGNGGVCPEPGDGPGPADGGGEGGMPNPDDTSSGGSGPRGLGGEMPNPEDTTSGGPRGARGDWMPNPEDASGGSGPRSLGGSVLMPDPDGVGGATPRSISAFLGAEGLRSEGSFASVASFAALSGKIRG